MEQTVQTSTITAGVDDEALIAAPVARRQLLGGISESTEWRWERQLPDFPKPIRINRRKYYRLGDLREFSRSRAVS